MLGSMLGIENFKPEHVELENFMDLLKNDPKAVFESRFLDMKFIFQTKPESHCKINHFCQADFDMIATRRGGNSGLAEKLATMYCNFTIA